MNHMRIKNMQNVERIPFKGEWSRNKKKNKDREEKMF